MNSTGNYLKWTGRLLEEFSSNGFDAASTNHSFYKPIGDKTHCFQQNQNQMQHYRRYADSLDAKINTYAPSQSLYSYLSRLPFVQYNHNQQKSCCAKQNTLKKRSIGQNKKGKPCQYCRDKKQNRKEQKAVQNNPIIIKEIERVYVPSPPTIIREIISPPINNTQPHIIVASQLSQPQQLLDPRVVRVQSQCRPASVGRVNFNYASAANVGDRIMGAEIKRSVILSPIQRQIVTTPFKMLQFSSKKPQLVNESRFSQKVQRAGEQDPRIVITRPYQLNRQIEVNYRQASYSGSNGFKTSHFIDRSQNQHTESSGQLGVRVGSCNKGSVIAQSLHTFGKIQ